MSEYHVFWEIDIEAGTHEQAAEQALAIQRDPDSTALLFDVSAVGRCHSCKKLYLHEDSCPVAEINGSGIVDEHIYIDLSKKEKKHA
jgi:hypothetical protein